MTEQDPDSMQGDFAVVRAQLQHALGPLRGGVAEIALNRIEEQFDTFRQAVEDFLESQGYNPLDIGQLLTSFAVSSPAINPEVSERVDVRPQGPPTGGNPSVGEARSETPDPAKERGTPGEWITGEEAKQIAREKLASNQETRDA